MKKCFLLRLPFLFPCLIPPRDDRENTERRAKRYRALAAKNPALFLRLSPKKVDLIPEKVDSPPKKVDCLPKKVDSIPETVDLHFSPLHPKPEKSRLNAIFLAQSKIIHYLCRQIYEQYRHERSNPSKIAD